MSALKSSTAPKAIGQRAMFQKSLKLLPRPVRRTTASPSAPPKMISRNIPASTRPVATTSTNAISRCFQNGRVSRRS